MRRLSLVLAVVIAAAAVGVSMTSPVPEAQAAQVQFRQVNITVSCDGADVDSVTIRPWTVKATRNLQQIRWHLLQPSDITSAQISPKSTSSWPAANGPPLTVNRNSTVDSGALNTAGDFFYNITVRCPGAGADTVIDPKMDIDG